MLVAYKLLATLNRLFGTGSWQGIEMDIHDDGRREVKEWRRHPWTEKLTSIFRRDRTSSDESEQEQITERTRLLG